MTITVICLIVLVIGLALYTIPQPTPPTAASARRQEIGRIMFAFGLLVLLLRLDPTNWPRLHIGN
jgi:hypothetical protein